MSKQMLALITARGKSKGLSGKNLRQVGGESLISRAIRGAFESDRFQRVLVSTDDEGIAAASIAAGADVPFLRPAELAMDASGHYEVVAHALDWLEANQNYSPDIFVLLQPTSPLRSSFDIARAVDLMSPGDDAVVGVSSAREHPSVSVTLTPTGQLRPFLPGATHGIRRQDRADAFHVNGAIYVLRVKAFREFRTFVPESARAYVMPFERSVDVNDWADLVIAEALWRDCLRQTQDG